MKALLLTTLILSSFATNAQQEHLSSMYWNNYSEFNPATSGLVNKHQAMVSYRNQSPSISGNPRTFFANYNAKVGRHHGVGGNITSGKFGYGTFQEIQANYNYQLVLGNSRRISFGAGPSLYRHTFSFPGTSIESRSNTLNFNTGIAYQGKSILAGVGATQLFAIELSNDPATSLIPHYYAHFRKIFELTWNLDLYLEGLYQTSDSFHVLEFNARVVYYNKFMLGVGYRSKDTYIAHIGWDINDQFRIAYAYDRTVNKLSSSFSTSHEFTLGYVMKYTVQPRDFRRMSSISF
ncbi:MAG: type IX secretion system membrane protein PorP/SprF [Crocinitomicaceae bacterium]|nr:type IX secretion system membrane protein PorP/SprF [Crocinitomicaceae bacterium]